MRFNIHLLWKAKFLTNHRFARFIWAKVPARPFCGCRNFSCFFGETAPACCVFFPVCLCYTMVTKHRLPVNLPNCTYTAHENCPVKTKKRLKLFWSDFPQGSSSRSRATVPCTMPPVPCFRQRGGCFCFFCCFIRC